MCSWKLTNFSLRYVIEPPAIIDLIAILPAIELTILTIMDSVGFTAPEALTGGALINLRLLRIVRLQRVLTDNDTFFKFEQSLGLKESDARPYQLQLARVVISIFTLLGVTSGLIYSAEHKVNADIPDYFTALYFSLTTLTTVGFGDIHPVTSAGRWVVSGSILIGSAVVPAQAAALVEAFLDREEDNSNKDIDDAAIDAAEEVALVTACMDRLEEKLDDTNERISELLTFLEAQEAAKVFEETPIDEIKEE